MGQIYRCIRDLMEKCEDYKNENCDGTYMGTECECSKKNRNFSMFPTEQDELKAYRATGMRPEEINHKKNAFKVEIIDTVPVVRCWKCKKKHLRNGKWFCEVHGIINNLDGFCDWGEQSDAGDL